MPDDQLLTKLTEMATNYQEMFKCLNLSDQLDQPEIQALKGQISDELKLGHWDAAKDLLVRIRQIEEVKLQARLRELEEEQASLHAKSAARENPAISPQRPENSDDAA